jgi:hypothetical protein
MMRDIPQIRGPAMRWWVMRSTLDFENVLYVVFINWKA